MRARASRSFFVVVALGSALVAAACSLITEGTLDDKPGEGGAGAHTAGSGGNSSGSGGNSSGSGGNSSGSGGSTSGSGGSGGVGGSGGASGGSGGASGGSGGSGGTPCVPTTEDCVNGVDDDCDDLADCEDTDSCGGYTCIDVPAGGTLVEPVGSQGQCSTPLIELQRGDCSACTCSVANNDYGTCTHVAYLYTTSDCQGQPDETILVPAGEGCTAAPDTTAEVSDTVGAVGDAIGLGDADCQPDAFAAAVTTRYFCALPAPGFCQNGDGCAPSSVSCLLLDGDVDCPAPFGNKEIVFDTTAGSCDCSCSTASQTCQAGAHFHADAADGCNGTKFDVDYGTGCNDTGLSNVRGVRDHGADPIATGASCGADGTAQNAPSPKTVCCP